MNTSVQSLQQHGVHVQEVDREDPGGLGAEKLPPGRAGTARRRIDARAMQDLPDGGRRDRHAEVGQFAVDPPVSTPRILCCEANDKAGDAPGIVGGRPGLRRVLVSYFLAASLRCQASSVAGGTGKTSAQRLRGMSRASAANHTRSAGEYRTCWRSGAAPRSRAGAPAVQRPSPGRPSCGCHRDSQAEYPADQQVAREQPPSRRTRPARQPSPCQACWRQH